MKKLIINENWPALIKFRAKKPIIYGIKLGADYKKAIKTRRYFSFGCNEKDFCELRDKFSLYLDLSKDEQGKVSEISLYIPNHDDLDIVEIVRDLARYFTKHVPYEKKFKASYSYHPDESLKDCNVILENTDYYVEIELDKGLSGYETSSYLFATGLIATDWDYSGYGEDVINGIKIGFYLPSTNKSTN